MTYRARMLLSLATVALAPVACTPEERESSPPALEAGAPEQPAPASRRIVFLGTSLTAGLGVDPDSAYPARIQAMLDAEGVEARVVNAGVSGETSAGGLRRASWALGSPFAVLVLELGANDGLRGTDPADTKANLQAIIDLARERAPDAEIVLLGMEAPPNLGTTYTAHFRAIFEELAVANGATLVPFLLEGVAGVDSLNQADRIHPTAAGHAAMARTVWPYLRPLL